jgi:serine-type D-Ala-D-Ala carboxypeptidase/endopeptidase
MNSRIMQWPALGALLLLTACGGSDDSGDEGAFGTVDSTARAAFESQRIPGMGLTIYNRDGAKVFEQMYGDFSPDARVAIASASKLVSGAVIFRLLDAGELSLDSTTGQVLGWTGDQAAITLRQLLSFTSGLAPENQCTYDSTVTLSACVATISQTGLTAQPGTRFDYGSVHLAVAGRMAEVVTGQPWNAIFETQLRDPLGLPGDIVYYANPLEATGTQSAAGRGPAPVNERVRAHPSLRVRQRRLAGHCLTGSRHLRYSNSRSVPRCRDRELSGR